MYGIYEFLRAKGHNVIYCYGRDNDPSNDKNLVKIANNLEVYSHVALSRLTGLQGYYSYIATKKLIRIIDNIRPDVVIIGNLHGYYVNYKMLLSELKEREILTYYYMLTNMLSWEMHFNSCDKYLQNAETVRKSRVSQKSVFDTSNKIFKDKINLYTGFKSFDLLVFHILPARRSIQPS